MLATGIDHLDYRSETRASILRNTAHSWAAKLREQPIYWVKLGRLLNALSGRGLEFLTLAAYGNGLGDSVGAIQRLAGDPDVTIRFVLYQFNLNDITPYDRAALNMDVWQRCVQG